MLVGMPVARLRDSSYQICEHNSEGVKSKYHCFEIITSHPLPASPYSPYHSRGRLADAINANNFCHRQVSLCFACKIGGTFSSRVSEQCMSACRLHDCETHRTRIVNTIRRGVKPHTAASTLFYSTPPGLCPTSPIFCYAKSSGGLFAYTLTPQTKPAAKCLKCCRIDKCPEVLPCFDREPRSAHVRASNARLAVTCHEVTEGSV